MELLKNKEVKLIIFCNRRRLFNGNVRLLRLRKIKTLKPKWMQGYSDITTLEFIFNTI